MEFTYLPGFANIGLLLYDLFNEFALTQTLTEGTSTHYTHFHGEALPARLQSGGLSNVEPAAQIRFEYV